MEKENLPMTRQEAVEWLKSMPQQESDMNHYLESEAIMKKLAEKLGKKDEKEYWGMLGLLHDIDWALTKNNWKEHGKKAEQILKEKGFDDKFIQIIQSHVYGHEECGFQDKERKEDIEHALAASETLTGLIYAYALMREKKISDMELKGLKKKFKDKSFASNCDREIIREIEKITPLNEFFELSINVLKEIKEQIGLK